MASLSEIENLRIQPLTTNGKIKVNNILQGLKYQGYEWVEIADTEEENICDLCEMSQFHCVIKYGQMNSNSMPFTRRIVVDEHFGSCTGAPVSNLFDEEEVVYS